jgi:phospholipase/carboxylesterase
MTFQTLELLPPDQAPDTLFILLHGYGDRPEGLLGLGGQLRAAFPKAAVIIPPGFAESVWPDGREWYSLEGMSREDEAVRVTEALPRLAALVRGWQNRLGITNPDTAVVGFSQGAVMALELGQFQDGLAGRVVAFAGRYLAMPDHAPELTTIHLLHGEADDVMPVAHSEAAFDRLTLLHGDATLDTASGVGHELHPALVEVAIERLRGTIPMRTWKRALGMG